MGRMCFSAVTYNSAFLRFKYLAVLGQIFCVLSKNVFIMNFFGTGKSYRVENDFACSVGLLVAMKMLFQPTLLQSFIVKVLRIFVRF